jgi:hypothetical protein
MIAGRLAVIAIADGRIVEIGQPVSRQSLISSIYRIQTFGQRCSAKARLLVCSELQSVKARPRPSSSKTETRGLRQTNSVAQQRLSLIQIAKMRAMPTTDNKYPFTARITSASRPPTTANFLPKLALVRHREITLRMRTIMPLGFGLFLPSDMLLPWPSRAVSDMGPAKDARLTSSVEISTRLKRRSLNLRSQ